MADRTTGQQLGDTRGFVAKWAGRPLPERSAAQSHFIDLCRLLGVAAPADQRETDASYGFEARTEMSASGVKTEEDDQGNLFYRVETGSGSGFADVWMRDHFAWEYKRANKYRHLKDALAQVRLYAPSLGNPPLLVVCDIDRIEIHTNFNGYPSETVALTINDLANPSDAWKAAHPRISPVEVLRKLWDDPEWFRPRKTRAAVTEDLAKQIGELAKSLRDGGNEPHAVAHFIMQIVFCFFAEDIGLLPRNLFTDLIDKSRDDSERFPAKAKTLFKAMERGGHFGSDTIRWFNGGLYHEVDADPEIHIASGWLGKLLLIARADWNAVDPTILGTLFERSLDPDKRSQIGAHYTSRDDIMLIVGPVILTPLRRAWAKVQKDVAKWLAQREKEGVTPAKKASLRKKIERAITGFQAQLAEVRVLDPACGSGNFLFVTIRELLNLEQEVLAYAADPRVNLRLFPRVAPTNLRGIDVNDYACELARVSIWIGYLQWLYANTGDTDRAPVLDPLDTIEHRDAILAWADEEGNPIPVYRDGAVCTGVAEWPEADFIVGNPPFLGRGDLRSGLGTAYLDILQSTYSGLPQGADLCCYWFEQGSQQIRRARLSGRQSGTPRIGLLATQSIRNGSNRVCLSRVTDAGRIFWAISDREWYLEGASVHISMICFDDGTELTTELDGQQVSRIFSDLTSDLDLSLATPVSGNEHVAFQGTISVGDFDIDHEKAHQLLARPTIGGGSAFDVVKPWTNARDVTSRPRGRWVVYFGEGRTAAQAAEYEAAFQHAETWVRPYRDELDDDTGEVKRAYITSDTYPFWQLWNPRQALVQQLAGQERYVAVPRVGKHRVFVWLHPSIVPDNAVVAFAREDDYFLGVLSSCAHVLWSLRQGSQLETRPRYTPTSCFETFPFPWRLGREAERDPLVGAIALQTEHLASRREAWLNPPQWLKPIEDAVDRFEDFSDVPEEARPLLRRSAIMARAAKDKNLKKRTLTNLYNERPHWLKLAHKALDEAVLAAYAAVDPEGGWDPAWAAAYEPFGAGEITIVTSGRKPDPPEVVEAKQAAIEARKEVDQLILANLLRLNQERAGG